MTEDVWSERDTTPEAIDSALRRLLRERHAANQALAPARVLNLVVVVDRDWKGEIANRLARVGRYNPSRTVLCAVQPGRRTLDATVVMSYDDPGEGIGVIRESVEVDMGIEHLDRIETIVDPILISEAPTVLWCPHGHEQALRELLAMTDVVLVDSDQEPEAAEALGRAGELLASAYVVDLAWLRTTPWRERVAASFDPPSRRAALREIGSIAVRHRSASSASALLWAGWMASRLGWEATPLKSGGVVGMTGAARLDGREVAVEILRLADQDVPGLAGVTIDCGQGFSLSLDRGPGGLQARQRTPDGGEKRWRVLGASRGEGGILGEGVRQALLRDPTYGPALQAARGFCAA